MAESLDTPLQLGCEELGLSLSDEQRAQMLDYLALLARWNGTYNLTGNKIFITCGDQDLTANIIHPVLARIEGDPPGTKGISLFLVPKYFVNDDGSLGDRNDIVCSGVEETVGTGRPDRRRAGELRSRRNDRSG